MGERKVLNKYIPADFDPALIPRGTKLSAKDGTVPVRMMLPFSIQCSTCHTFLYRGRKFNSKKEAMGGPNGKYLGITRWRFYIKCTQCARPITFLTDPQHADYEMESGGTRNYEVYKDKEQTETAAAEATEQEETLDPMKALENRVADSQREMAELDALEQIKAMNARHVQLMGSNNKVKGKGNTAGGGGGGDDMVKTVLDAIDAAKQKQQPHGNDEQSKKAETDDLLTKEDEELIKSIQFAKHARNTTQHPIRRLGEEDERRLEEQRRRQAAELEKRLVEQEKHRSAAANQKKVSSMAPAVIKVVKRKRIEIAADSKQSLVEDATALPSNKERKTTHDAASVKSNASTNPISQLETAVDHPPAANLAGLLGGYGTDSSDD